MNSNNKYAPCPCDSKMTYQKCCRPYHQGEAAPTALALMRSRYAAYALGLSDYIMATTHRDNHAFMEDKVAWRKDLDRFCRSTSFDGLTIVLFEDGAETASVTFRAYLRAAGSDVGFSEKSGFAKVDGRWYYKDGQVSD